MPAVLREGAALHVGEAVGDELLPAGVRVGGGVYEASGERLAALREAMADDKAGPRLQRILRDLERGGFEIGGERLKTVPRGYDKDHPRIDLLRHKSITAGHLIGFEPVIHTPDLLKEVRKDWRAVRPMAEWIAEVAPAGL